MPSVIWGFGTPPAAATYAGETGDIFVNSITLAWHRFALSPRAWTAIVPPNFTLFDNLLSGGQLNDRVAKVGGNPFALGFANAADGVVRQLEHPTASRTWDLTHQLGSRFVNVSVITPGALDPDATQTILMPDIEYVSVMRCILHFTTPKTGTAIVRR